MASANEKLLSIIVPFFNEGQNVVRIYQDIKAMGEKLPPRFGLEIIFVDNHSTDESTALAIGIAEKDPAVRLLRFSRNFGYQTSIMTGYLQCRGDVAVQVDSDGEDDPMIVIDFLKEWEKGFDVVYGVRKARVEPWYVTWQRKVFYRFINRISQINLPLDAGDFRLIDRKVIDKLRLFEESTLYIRGLISYIGFRQTGIPYSRRKRYDGKSKFGWFGAVEFAWQAIAAFSSRPLLYVAYAGVIFSLVSIAGALIGVGSSLFSDQPLSGNFLIGLLTVFMTGVQLFAIGIVGAYVGRIYEESKRRPRAIIEVDFQKGVQGV